MRFVITVNLIKNVYVKHVYNGNKDKWHLPGLACVAKEVCFNTCLFSHYDIPEPLNSPKISLRYLHGKETKKKLRLFSCLHLQNEFA